MGLQSRVDDERVGREAKTASAVNDAVAEQQARFEEMASVAQAREQARTESMYQRSQETARKAQLQGRQEGYIAGSQTNPQQLVQEGHNQAMNQMSEAAMAEEQAMEEEAILEQMMAEQAAMEGAQPGMQPEGNFAPNPNIPPAMAPQQQQPPDQNQLNNGQFVPNPQPKNALTEYAKNLAMMDDMQQQQ